MVTRLVAQKLAENLKINVVIDNRGGGGGVPAALAIKQAAPDGYTLFLANNGVFAIMPALHPDIRFDPIKDFQPVTPLFSFPSVLVVPAGSPAKSAKELVALAKTKPGGLQLRLAGRRLRRSHPGRDVPARVRRADDARAVSRRRSGGERPRRRQRRFPVQLLRVGDRPGRRPASFACSAGPRPSARRRFPTCRPWRKRAFRASSWKSGRASWRRWARRPRSCASSTRNSSRRRRRPTWSRKVAAQAVDITTSTPDEFAKLIASDVDRLGKVIRDAGIKRADSRPGRPSRARRALSGTLHRVRRSMPGRTRPCVHIRRPRDAAERRAPSSARPSRPAPWSRRPRRG